MYPSSRPSSRFFDNENGVVGFGEVKGEAREGGEERRERARDKEANLLKMLQGGLLEVHALEGVEGLGRVEGLEEEEVRNGSLGTVEYRVVIGTLLRKGLGSTTMLV